MYFVESLTGWKAKTTSERHEKEKNEVSSRIFRGR